MERTEEEIVNLNRKQLYSGLGRDGRHLSPKYTEDPYFKTVEAAIRYAKWKQMITPDPERPWDVPNLFINGRYHGSIKLNVSGDRYTLGGTDPNAADIELRFKMAMGLTEASTNQYRQQTLYPHIVESICAKTGAQSG